MQRIISVMSAVFCAIFAFSGTTALGEKTNPNPGFWWGICWKALIVFFLLVCLEKKKVPAEQS